MHFGQRPEKVEKNKRNNAIKQRLPKPGGAYFVPGGAKMELRHQIFEFLHRLFTGGRVEVAVYPQGGLDVLVAQPLAHQEDRGVELDQQRSVGVP